MKCMASRKKQKPRMTPEEKKVWNQLTTRYTTLRMRMSHEKAMEQLRKEAENAGLTNKNTEDNGAVHEAGSDNIEERED